MPMKDALKLLDKLSKLRKAEMSAHVGARKYGRACNRASASWERYLRLSEQADKVEAELRALLSSECAQ